MLRQKSLEGTGDTKRFQAQKEKGLAPSELFHHRPDYGVLICITCHYAIQPGAIRRHLKDIHHLHHEKRRPYVAYTKELKLKRPEEVQSPLPDDFPIPQLPVEKGWRCLAPGCNYLCASNKRMENHWPAVHARKGNPETDWHFTLLQTFFRGRMLRYFTGQNQRQLQNTRDKSGQIAKPGEAAFTQDQQPETSLVKSLQEKYHLDALDSQLLRHYFDSSYKTFVANKKTENVWIEVVPGLTCDNKFLLQGMLACTALHMAHSNPAERQKYTLRGCSHQEAAIPEFRKAIESPTEDNCDAIMAFAYLLVVYSLATDLEQSNNPLLIIDASPSDTQQIIPPWLHFIRTGCYMLKDVWHRIESGRASILAYAWERNLDVSDEEKQSHLDFFLSIIPEEDAWPEESTRVYHHAANLLAESFAYVDRAKRTIGLTAWSILGTWPVRIEQGFFTLTSEKHPGALILLAHYCVILNQIGDCWYIGERPAILTASISRILDKRWHPYIEGAVKEVLGPGGLEGM
ncbi:fungal specific transcription factor domain-containing protein [Penicillium cosmopolitanum]|uniref:Fungal specific transcription factor domain-containing protein n=1 Tax=Penicillium cosmopolitanum TaxID=1131564 RepID=A0A9X0B7X6_9EURO|nr:fungal specific transcription factor domain-containing protein [Penicillium cosmopolitanum]KAJ5391520.1 fungal specific transcription factor domain-containing protein [Penicillium cosmopolitanum]